MKFVRNKIIKDHAYYYFEYPLKTTAGTSIISYYIGAVLPINLREKLLSYFNEIAALSEKQINDEAKKYFFPKPLLPIEQCKFWYKCLHNELFMADIELFRSLFGILFILNSNRSEGSKVTRKDIEKLIRRKQKAKTPLDIEIINSLEAMKFAFSKQMKWNLKSIKKIHWLLFNKLSPSIAGKIKEENNVINNEPTTPWEKAKHELSSLLKWFLDNKKKYYPPILALEFHHRFESIHPFTDGNGRIGRLLFNAYLLQQGFMPVIFFSENHSSYSNAISQARQGRKKKLAHYFINQLQKTKNAIIKYKKEKIIKGGSPQVGRWEIEQGKIRKY